MAHDADTRRAVREAYLGGLALDQAAARAGVPAATARRWKAAAREAGEDWDRLRNVAMLAAGGGLEAAIGRVVAMVVTQGEETMRLLQADAELAPLERTQAIASLTDSLGKASAVAARLMPQTSRLGIALDVIRRLTDHIATHHPAQAAAWAELLEPFGDEIAKAYGG